MAGQAWGNRVVWGLKKCKLSGKNVKKYISIKNNWKGVSIRFVKSPEDRNLEEILARGRFPVPPKYHLSPKILPFSK